MSDKPPANPDDLTAAAKKFFAAAEELRRIGDMLTRRTQDLVSGSDAWAGSASEQFQAAWDRFGADTSNGANTLDNTANTLNKLAIAIQHVQASPAGKLVRAIDAGHVRVVPNSVHSLVPGAAVSTVSASDAASAKTAVSDGYDQAAAVGASDFAAAANATASGAHLAGGANSAAVGIAQTGWSAATLAAALERATSADYTETATSDSKHAAPGEQSNAAAPMAPGIFTTGTGNDGAAYGAAGYGSDGSGADGWASSFDDDANAAAPPDNVPADGQPKTRIYRRADLGGSPSDAALAAARGQGSDTASAWA